jgi:ABC-type glycerol-3-phosphate transport system substrate-binding protein
MKRLFSILLGMLLFVSLGLSPVLAQKNRIVIEYWHRNSASAGGPTIDAYAKAFNESQTKYTIKPVFMADAYKGIMQKLMAEAATGKAPGVVQVGYYWLNFLAENYKFVDIKTLDKAYLKNYLQNIIDLCTASDGRVAGIPYSFSCPIMYYNKDLLAKAGLDASKPPATVDELYAWARQVKDKTGYYGLAMAAASDFWLEQWSIESNGGRMVKYGKDGTMTATFASPEGVEGLQRISDLITKDKAATYVLGETIKEAFTSGKVAMIAATIGWSTGIKAGASFDMVTSPMPTYGSKTPRVPVGGNFLAITAQSRDQQKGSWEWIKFLTTKKAYYEWTIATGYLPPRTDVQPMPEFQEYLKKNPLLVSAFKQMPNIVPFVAFPGDVGLEIEQGLLDTRDAIMNGSVTAQKGLGDLQTKANSLMGR